MDFIDRDFVFEHFSMAKFGKIPAALIEEARAMQKMEDMMQKLQIIIISFCLVSGMTITANAQQSLLSSSASQPLGDIQQLHQQIAALRQQEEPLKQQIRAIEEKIRPLRQQIVKLGGGHHQSVVQHNKPVKSSTAN